MKNMTQNQISIGKKKLGENEPCFIVAEAGINFDGDRKKAIQLIDESANAGCDAVKFQIFKSEKMYAKDAGNLITASGTSVNIHQLIKQAEIPIEWLKELKKYAESKGLEFFASVCDENSADILESIKSEAYKIASYEITHIPLIKHCSKKGKPLIISCGGATIIEVAEAIEEAKKAGQHNIVLMHCIAEYNAPLETLNLSIIKTLKLQFPEIVIGYSDHSSDSIIAPTAAISLGAKMIEKHITLDRNSPGPDHSFALEPDELKSMVLAIRSTEKKISQGKKIIIDERVLGSSKRQTFKNEEYIRKFAYRLIFAIKDIQMGETLSKDNIAVLRSGESYKKYLNKGLHPRYYELLVNNSYVLTKNIKIGQAISWDNVLSK